VTGTAGGQLGGGATRDPGLQPERTSLAWRRTGLAATTAALALARVAMLQGARLIAAVAVGLAIVALGALVEGSLRHDVRQRWFEDDRAESGLSLAARTSVLAVIVLSLIGLGLTLTT
jgi:uncharacterized membrane protein YidH (DUF202 family)